MTKEVLIRISGSHYIESDPEADLLELIVPGEYYFRNGKHYLIYDEVMEENMAPVHNVVKIADKMMEITKNGDVGSKLHFEKNSKKMSKYTTPYGQMMVAVNTKDLHMKEEEHSLKVEVEYSLEINYEHVSDCRLVLDVSSRGETKLAL